MASSPIIVKRGPSKVIQGTPAKVAAELEKMHENEEVTLIVPGPELAPMRSVTAETPLSFDAVFGPLQAGFEASGLTEAQLAEAIDAEIKQYRASKQTEHE